MGYLIRFGVDFADKNFGLTLIKCGNEKLFIEDKVDDDLGFKFLFYWRNSPISFSHIINHQLMVYRVFSVSLYDLNHHKGRTTRLFDTHDTILFINRYLSKSLICENLDKRSYPSFRVYHISLIKI